jgi:hypothetical protein
MVLGIYIYSRKLSRVTTGLFYWNKNPFKKYDVWSSKRKYRWL